MPRLLSALLIALAMFCAPLAMGVGGSAMARPATATTMTVANATTVMAMESNCPGMNHAMSSDRTPTIGDGCAIGCAAVLALPTAIAGEVLLARPLLFATRAAALSGIWPEADSPPPRLAPAI